MATDRPRTLISPLTVAEHGSLPAIMLPGTSPVGRVNLDYNQLHNLVNTVRHSLDTWSGYKGTNKPLKQGDVVSMSLVNGTEFAAAFLGITAHR